VGTEGRKSFGKGGELWEVDRVQAFVFDLGLGRRCGVGMFPLLWCGRPQEVLVIMWPSCFDLLESY